MSDPEPDSRAGSQFGPYQIRRLLGRGGIGEIDDAEDAVNERIAALKLLPQAISQDPAVRKRVRRKALSAGRLHVPHTGADAPTSTGPISPSPTRGGRRTTDVACQRLVPIWTAGAAATSFEDPPRPRLHADVAQHA